MGNDLRLIDRISFDTGQDIRPGASMPVDFGNRPERGTLHGVNGCEAGIRIYYVPVNGNCLLLDTTDLKRETLYREFNALRNAPNPIFRLNLRQGNWSAAQLAQVPHLAPCIQELNAAVGTHPEFWAMLGQLTSLQDLDIERNNLRTLPDQLANLTNLIVLDIEHNRFTEVPPVLEQMSFLRNIKLEGNPITDLPAWLYDFPQLESLDLSLTNITRFPDDIGKLTDTLRALGLYGLRLAPGEQERLRRLLPTTQFFF